MRPLPGAPAGAFAINDCNQVAGAMDVRGQTRTMRANRWNPDGTMTPLGPLRRFGVLSALAPANRGTPAGQHRAVSGFRRRRGGIAGARHSFREKGAPSAWYKHALELNTTRRRTR
jgi:hypothetical protein